MVEVLNARRATGTAFRRPARAPRRALQQFSSAGPKTHCLTHARVQRVEPPIGSPSIPRSALPADATHQAGGGDLDRQVEILGVIGRLELELIEAR